MPLGPLCKNAEDELEEAILCYSYQNIAHVVESMTRVFGDNKDHFDDFVTRLLGLDDQTLDVDEELGSSLIQLHQKVLNYDRSMAALHALIQHAAKMTDLILYLHMRLRHLLRRISFADKIYNHICTLGFPERAHGTFVQAAKMAPAFASLKFHLKPAPPSPKRVKFVAPPTATSKRATRMPSTIKYQPNATSSLPLPPPPSSIPNTSVKPAMISSSNTSFTNNTAKSSRSHVSLPEVTIGSIKRPAATSSASVRMSSVPPHLRGKLPEKKPSQVEQSDPPAPQAVPTRPHTDIHAVVLLYLEADDQTLSSTWLQPASKRDAVHLASSVLFNNMLQTFSPAWYSFGFVTTRSEDEERQLGGLYTAILKESPNPPMIFRELIHALESNTLVALFDRKGYEHFRTLFPRLETFLCTPPTKRSTVWRLIHYLRIDHYTEPAPVLKRDFGYQFIKNHQEVTLLNGIYARILAKSSPRELHDACRRGRLAEFALQKGVHVELKDRRFLKNDYGYPGVGFDGGEVQERHRVPLFRRANKL
jgi:hypothetical protein